MARVLDAWCGKCLDVRKHTLVDPGSCRCQVCGEVTLLMKPLAPDQVE